MHNSQEFEDIVEQLRRSMELAKISFSKARDDSEDWELYKHDSGTWSSLSTGDVSLEKSLILDKRLAAFLSKKEKLEAAHLQVVRKRVEKELTECTFKPARNSKSKDIIARSPPKSTPLHHPKVPKDPLTPEADTSPKYPQISPISRALVERQDRSGPVYERLKMLEQERRQRLEEKAREKLAEEEKSVTSAPKLSRNTVEIIRRRAQAGEIPSLCSGVVQRLGELEVRPLNANSFHLKFKTPAHVFGPQA